VPKHRPGDVDITGRTDNPVGFGATLGGEFAKTWRGGISAPQPLRRAAVTRLRTAAPPLYPPIRTTRHDQRWEARTREGSRCRLVLPWRVLAVAVAIAGHGGGRRKSQRKSDYGHRSTIPEQILHVF
jgi:hypothetical protein